MISTKGVKEEFQINGQRVPLYKLPPISHRTELLVKECGFLNYPELAGKPFSAEKVQEIKRFNQLERELTIRAVVFTGTYTTVLASFVVLLIATNVPMGLMLLAYMGPIAIATGVMMGEETSRLNQLKWKDAVLLGPKLEIQKYLDNSYRYYQAHGEGLERAISAEITKEQHLRRGQFPMTELEAARKEIQNLRKFYEQFGSPEEEETPFELEEGATLQTLFPSAPKLEDGTFLFKKVNINDYKRK